MKLISINNVEKKDVPLYYRNEYTAIAEFLLIGNNQINTSISFSIEMVPTGEKNIEITLTESIDYPIVPIIKTLKSEIEKMEKEGLFL
ncbi:MAG: hypothetical protein JEY91_11985 [Spirochaetaceae bacterium]|nr:hypothetical protein [Spirochaetaceae bacterium]